MAVDNDETPNTLNQQKRTSRTSGHQTLIDL